VIVSELLFLLVVRGAGARGSHEQFLAVRERAVAAVGAI
jgi:hypothetical protein